MLFETYKMCLHEDHCGVPVAYALNGKSFPLLKVIALSLKYLKDDAMAEINRSQPKALFAHEIKWVVTGSMILILAPCPRLCILGTCLQRASLPYSLLKVCV